MAFTVSYDTSAIGIYGVYSPNIITLSDDNANHIYFDVSISCNTSQQTIRLYRDANNTAFFDINKLLQAQFNSDVNNYTPSLYKYTTTYNSVLSTGGPTVIQGDNSSYVINGIKPNYDRFVINSSTGIDISTNYGGLKPMFLNEQPQHLIYWDSSTTNIGNNNANNELELAWISGTGYKNKPTSKNYSQISKLNITLVTKAGQTYTLTPSIVSSGNIIQSVKIDPYTLINSYGVTNASMGNTDYYTVKDASLFSETIVVNVEQPNNLNDKYFRLTWINRNGVKQHFSFNHNYIQKLNKKELLFNTLDVNKNSYSKSFGMKVEEIYNISTDWLNESQSSVIESLITSPSVKATALYTNMADYNKDLINGKLIVNKYIVIDTNSIVVKRRKTDGLINYSIDFILANDFNIQQF